MSRHMYRGLYAGGPGAALSMALLGALAAAPVAAQQRGSATARAPRAASTDSVERQIRRLQRQLDSLTQDYNERDLSATERRGLEEQLSHTVAMLREMAMRLDGDGSREVRVRLMSPNGENGAMARAFVQARTMESAMPGGWIGIVAEGAGLEPRVENGELIIRYLSYPRIMSVDPSSPAQRAGLVPADTLIAYNGVDVRENDISLTRLLRPNAKLMVRVRRDGRTRDVPVVVAVAPGRIALRRSDEVRRGDASGFTPLPAMPSFPRGGIATTIAPRAPMASSAPMSPMTPMAPMAPTPGAQGVTARIPMMPAIEGVAGAQLIAITPGLARTVGVERGVLIVRSPVGSPANESGLLDGDVLVKVAGQPVVTVTDVRGLVETAADNGERQVEVEIVRAKRHRKVVLRWD